MPTTPSLEAISLVDLTTVTGGCGGKKKCCCPPPQSGPAPQAASQLPPSDNVNVAVNVLQ